TISADQAPVKDTQIALTISGDAVSGKDYPTLPPYVLMPSGATSVNIPVIALTDDTIENDERIIVAITQNPTQYRVGPASQAVVTIARGVGEGALPLVRLDGSASRTQEGQPLSLTATLDKPLADALELVFGYSGSAREGDDFTPV